MSHHPTSDEPSVLPQLPLGSTVLLVDDDAKLLRGLTRSLSDEFNLITAVSPAEANVLLRTHTVDVVVSDNLMSGVLGTDFLRDVRSQYPDIKLIMLSGYIPPAAAKRIVDELGVLCVLTKPCSHADVSDAIRLALSQRC